MLYAFDLLQQSYKKIDTNKRFPRKLYFLGHNIATYHKKKSPPPRLKTDSKQMRARHTKIPEATTPHTKK